MVSDECQKKAVKFIDRLGDILAKPQPSDPSPAYEDSCLVDRHLDFLEHSVRTIRIAVEMLDVMDMQVLMNHLDEIRSIEGELQGHMKDILYLDDMGVFAKCL